MGIDRAFNTEKEFRTARSKLTYSVKFPPQTAAQRKTVSIKSMVGKLKPKISVNILKVLLLKRKIFRCYTEVD